MSEREKVDCVVTAWYPDKSGFRKWGNGFIRSLYSGKRFYLKETNIIATGVETLGRGSYVRCDIGPAKAEYQTEMALNVEIFMAGAADAEDPATPVEDKQDVNF